MFCSDAAKTSNWPDEKTSDDAANWSDGKISDAAANWSDGKIFDAVANWSEEEISDDAVNWSGEETSKETSDCLSVTGVGLFVVERPELAAIGFDALGIVNKEDIGLWPGSKYSRGGVSGTGFVINHFRRVLLSSFVGRVGSK